MTGNDQNKNGQQHADSEETFGGICKNNRLLVIVNVGKHENKTKLSANLLKRKARKHCFRYKTNAKKKLTRVLENLYRICEKKINVYIRHVKNNVRSPYNVIKN